MYSFGFHTKNTYNNNNNYKYYNHKAAEVAI